VQQRAAVVASIAARVPEISNGKRRACPPVPCIPRTACRRARLLTPRRARSRPRPDGCGAPRVDLAIRLCAAALADAPDYGSSPTFANTFLATLLQDVSSDALVEVWPQPALRSTPARAVRSPAPLRDRPRTGCPLTRHPPPPPRTNRTRLVPPLVLIGHAASFTGRRRRIQVAESLAALRSGDVLLAPRDLGPTTLRVLRSHATWVASQVHARPRARCASGESESRGGPVRYFPPPTRQVGKAIKKRVADEPIAAPKYKKSW
jgi:hypothetical protein